MTTTVLVRVLLVAVVVVVLLPAAVWAVQRRLIYLPDPAPVPAAASVLPGAQDVRLHTADGLELGASARLVEIPGADHNDPVLLDGPELVESVLSLVPR